MRKKRSTGIHLEIKVLEFLDKIVESEKNQSSASRSEIINAIINAFSESEQTIKKKTEIIRRFVYISRNQV